MTHHVRENAPDFIQDHQVQRRPNKPSVSSADNLLEPMVFTKLQHFKWTVKFETGQPLLKTQNQLLGRLSAGDMVTQDDRVPQ